MIDYNVNVHRDELRIRSSADLIKNPLRESASIYFSQDEFIVYLRYTNFGIVTLLSNIGGLLGLFLGVSALSAVEFLYFFVIRLFNNLWWQIGQT